MRQLGKLRILQHEPVPFMKQIESSSLWFGRYLVKNRIEAWD
jgi:hypothetical protein